MELGNIICGWMIHSKDGSPMNMGAWRALEHETVRHVGQAVAIVIADTQAIARDAAEAVNVQYEELPSVTKMMDALKPESPQLHPEAAGNLIYDWELGDASEVDTVFNKCDRVVKLELTNNRLAPNAIEPRVAIAEYDNAEDHFTLWSTSQNPHVARLLLSAFYQVAPEHKLRVIAPDVGGGFGFKDLCLSGRDCMFCGHQREQEFQLNGLLIVQRVSKLMLMHGIMSLPVKWQ